MMKVVFPFLTLISGLACCERAEFGRLYPKQAFLSMRASLCYQIFPNESMPSNALRIHVESDKVRPDVPLMIDITTKATSVTWKLPVGPVPLNVPEGKTVSDYFNRTFILEDMDLHLTRQNLTTEIVVEVSTFNPMTTNFKLVVDFVKDFDLMKQLRVATITDLRSPVVYKARVPDGLEDGLLKVESPDTICAKVIVRESRPHADYYGNITIPLHEKKEKYMIQTLTQQGGFTISKERFSGMFYVYIEQFANDSPCGNLSLASTSKLRRKQLTLSITKSLSKNQLEVAIWFVLGPILILFALFAASVVFIFLKLRHLSDADQPNIPHSVIEEPISNAPNENPQPGPSMGHSASQNPPDENRMYADIETMKRNLMSEQQQPSAPFEPNAVVPFNNGDDRESAEQVNPYSDTEPLIGNQVVNSSESWKPVHTVITAGSFVFTPLLAMMFNQLELSEVTSDQDLCYRNHLCSHQYLGIRDFNHVFSNVAYGASGIFFGLFVTAWNKIVCQREVFGLPDQTNFYHLLSTCLLFESLMSACYHLCPTKENLQFDLLFIFIFLMAILLKNHSIMHPQSSRLIPLLISLIMSVVISLVETVFQSWLLSIVFMAAIGLSAPVLSYLHFYKDSGNWRNVISAYGMSLSVPVDWKEDKISLTSSGANILLIIFGIIMTCLDGNDSNTTSIYMLNMLALNVLFSTFCTYRKILKKHSHDNSKVILALAALSVGILIWIIAVTFFALNSYDVSVAPAQSHAMNTECELLHFYDNHDIWHLCSAFGAFVGLLVIFFLDRSVDRIPRSELIKTFST